MPPRPDHPDAASRRRELGDRLRELRARAGLSQEAVAHAAGMERSFYAKLEAGGHSFLVDRIWDLAGALGVEPSALFERPAGRPG